MEMQDADRRLIEWEARAMDDCCGCGCCCCCDRGEAGLHPQDTLIQLLRQKDVQLRRMTYFFAAALLLLLVGVLALLLMVGLGVPCLPSQPKEENRASPPAPSNKPESSSFKSDRDKPSAMLTVPVGKKKGNAGYLLWESSRSKAYCSGGVTYNEDEGDLVVPKEGLYRVYLQITYQGNRTQCSQSEMKLLIKVSRISDEYTKDDHLLSAVDTPNCSMETWSKSLYTSAVFELTANTRLHVTATHPELIAHNEQEVFFGAELVFPI